MTEINNTIIQTVLIHYPSVQGIHLFGSYGSDDAWPDSDVDIALLLTPEQARKEKNINQIKIDSLRITPSRMQP